MTDQTENLDQFADRMIRNEVHICLSSLVSTLASGYGAIDAHSGRGPGATIDLAALVEQAFELARPIDDYETAAIDAGMKLYPETGKIHWIWHQAEDPDESMVINYESWEEACLENDLDPYETEVYEHWAVSQWFGDKLAEHGERVDNDFSGMVVWARTCTGQGIASDYVVREIARECMGA